MHRKACTTAVCLFLASVVLGCDSGPEYYPVDYPTSPREPERRFVAPEWKPIDGDKATMAKLGQETMDALGYEEIIRRAEKMGWIKTVRVEVAQSPAGKVLIAQGAAVAAQGELVKLFTKYAFAAGVSAAADSPIPGPGDAVAVGILVIGLVHVGALAMHEVVAAQQAQAAKEEAERERCRKVNEACQQKCLPKLKHSDFGNQFHRCMRECREAAGCWKVM